MAICNQKILGTKVFFDQLSKYIDSPNLNAYEATYKLIEFPNINRIIYKNFSISATGKLNGPVIKLMNTPMIELIYRLAERALYYFQNEVLSRNSDYMEEFNYFKQKPLREFLRIELIGLILFIRTVGLSQTMYSYPSVPEDFLN